MSEPNDADSLDRLQRVIQAQGDLIEELRERVIFCADLVLSLGFDAGDLLDAA